MIQRLIHARRVFAVAPESLVGMNLRAIKLHVLDQTAIEQAGIIIRDFAEQCGVVVGDEILSVGSEQSRGFLALRMLASLKWLRRRGARFGQEQAAIEHWLAAIETAAREDWQLACEVALCGRLIKGYGATNERSKENLLHIVDHIVADKTKGPVAPRVMAIREAREAALTDEGGKAFDQALVRHGAAPRPVKPQPIVWMKKPSAGRAPAMDRPS